MNSFAREWQLQKERERLAAIADAIKALNKFDLGDQVGEGANAYAFKATHRQLSKPVFLKVYPYYDNEDALREPQMLSGISSKEPKCPNIVDVYDVEIIDTTDGKYILMQMEYVAGGSLLGIVTQNIVGQQDAIRTAISILNGVAYLHCQRILHRDLKPSNIVIENTTPKITDFGSVAFLPDAASFVSASRHSILYVPPEGWESPSKFGFASDIYQVGMVLYELVNGSLNYDELHYIEPGVRRKMEKEGRELAQLSSIETNQLAKLGIAKYGRSGELLDHGRSEKPYYSRKLRSIVKKATNPNMALRFQTAGDFLSKLSRLNVPNWVDMSSEEYFASNWRGKDWSVKCSSESIIVENVFESGRRRQVSGTAGKFTELEDAFSFIEEL